MPGVLLLPIDEELLCFIDLWCVPVVPAVWFCVWTLSPACKPLVELGGLSWANAVLEMQSTAPKAHAIEKCFMPVFLSVRRETSRDRVVSNKRTLTCLLKPLFSMSRATTIAAALFTCLFPSSNIANTSDRAASER